MSNLSLLPSCLNLPIQQGFILQAQRLFHGRGHAYAGLQHVTVDWLPPVILITLYAPASESDINNFAEWIKFQVPSCKSVQLQCRYQLKGPIDIILGEDIKDLIIFEDNLQFKVSLGRSRNIGIFLDMHHGRKWVQKYSKNKRVLNLFAYTCCFSVAAIAGNAKSVLNIDMSSAPLTVGRENHRLNHHSLAQVKFEKLNIFKSFGRIKKRGPFDLLICDPPTFQKGSVDIQKDYPKIMKRLNDFMASDGMLLLCLNAPELNRDFLLDQMADIAPEYKYIKQIDPPKVFVEAQGKGLKALCFKKA